MVSVKSRAMQLTSEDISELVRLASHLEIDGVVDDAKDTVGLFVRVLVKHAGAYRI